MYGQVKSPMPFSLSATPSNIILPMKKLVQLEKTYFVPPFFYLIVFP